MKFYQYTFFLIFSAIICALLIYFFNSDPKYLDLTQRNSIEIKKEYKIKGIDISHYQGKINWKNIQEQGIRFVYMKATQGINFPPCR